jgi:3-phosphoshikimate 1-carboxyvinyltransferase
MESFGVSVRNQQLTRFTFTGSECYQGQRYEIEPDASAASYFWGAAAITGGEITVEGLSSTSLQGDVLFCDCLEQMGCQVIRRPHGITVTGRASRGITVNMNAISDTVQTLAAVALFAEGSTTITGVAHNRFKETDRIADLARELRKLGAEVEEFHDGLKITPGVYRGAEIETYHDHRMAMSLSLAGLRIPGVVIKNPGCTAKTYPQFFQDFAKLAEK